MSLLFSSINRLTAPVPFNRDALSLEDLELWSEERGIHVVPEKSITTGVSLELDDEKLILYNPHLPEAEKILVVGHELGHHLLGHLDMHSGGHGFRRGSLFSHSGIEKDASIIGYLCLIPHSKLAQLLLQNRLDPEELYWDLQPWGELDEDFGYEICKARVRIFNALLKVIKSRSGCRSAWKKLQMGMFEEKIRETTAAAISKY